VSPAQSPESRIRTTLADRPRPSLQRLVVTIAAGTTGGGFALGLVQLDAVID
jgi:hypothetical protein